MKIYISCLKLNPHPIMPKSRKTAEQVPEVKKMVIFEDKFVSYQAGKPQVWVRLRPLPNSIESVFNISDDGKALKLTVETEARVPTRASLNKIPSFIRQCLSFKADGILQNSSQEETYTQTARDVIEKAMNGVSGVIVTLGPEDSGKNFTMFGTRGKYEQRGILPRALEDIFRQVEAKTLEMDYVIRIGVIELRKDKIRDLVTLCPFDLKSIGDEGPNGMLLQQIGCAEHGLVLLIRALTGQRYIFGSSYSHCHTVVYIDIEGRSLVECDSRTIKSRITLARIAAIPRRSKDIIVSTKLTSTQAWQIQPDGCTYFCGPNGGFRPHNPQVPITIEIPYSSGRTVDEDISIRRDLSFLEQMFIRVNELKKLHKKYSKLRRRGPEVIMKPPKPASSQTYRQNKLSHCLQDIISGNSEVRIVLLVRSERQYLSTTLEAMRFAERAKYIPTDKVQPFSLSPEELQKQNACRQQLEETTRKEAEELALKKQQEEAAELAAAKARSALQIDPAVANDPSLQNRRKSSKGSGYEMQDKDKRRRKPSLPRDSEYDTSLRGKNKNNNKRDRERGGRRRRKGTLNEMDNGKSSELEPEISVQQVDKVRVSFIETDQDPSSESQEPRSASYAEESEPSVTDGPINAKITGANVGEGNRVSWDWNVEGETVEPLQPTTNDPPSIPEAWVEFIKTPEGTQFNQDVDQKHKILRDVTREHNEVLQRVTMLLSVLNQQQSDLDIAQQIRHLKGDEYDANGNIILAPEEKDMFRKIQELQASRDEILEKLKNLKSQLYTVKQELDAGKTKCEARFQAFCLDQFGLIFGNSEDPTTAELLDPPPQITGPSTYTSKCNMPSLLGQTETEASKHYNELKRLAEEQAKQFLRFYYQRPPWNNFATLKP